MLKARKIWWALFAIIATAVVAHHSQTWPMRLAVAVVTAAAAFMAVAGRLPWRWRFSRRRGIPRWWRFHGGGLHGGGFHAGGSHGGGFHGGGFHGGGVHAFRAAPRGGHSFSARPLPIPLRRRSAVRKPVSHGAVSQGLVAAATPTQPCNSAQRQCREPLAVLASIRDALHATGGLRNPTTRAAITAAAAGAA